MCHSNFLLVSFFCLYSFNVSVSLSLLLLGLSYDTHDLHFIYLSLRYARLAIFSSPYMWRWDAWILLQNGERKTKNEKHKFHTLAAPSTLTGVEQVLKVWSLCDVRKRSSENIDSSATCNIKIHKCSRFISNTTVRIASEGSDYMWLNALTAYQISALFLVSENLSNLCAWIFAANGTPLWRT